MRPLTKSVRGALGAGRQASENAAVGARTRLRSGWDRVVLGGADPRGPRNRPADVLRFWFGRPPGPRFEVADALWLPTRIPCWGGHWASRVLDVDAIITRFFGALHERAAKGELDEWRRTPDGRLALIIVLDQLSRNIYRGTVRAFAQDARALSIVEEALSEGDDRAFNPLARTLLYLPLMHHENLELLDRCVQLYGAAHADAPAVPRTVLSVELASARRHREIVSRFGRYPHRNRILGRESTPEELRFLEERFSTF